MIDIAENRKTRKWTAHENRGRVLWALAYPLFRFSPRPFWGWRRALLRIFKARIGADVHIYPSVRITMPWNLNVGAQSSVGDHAIIYALGPVEIGPRSTVSQYAHLCAGTHNWRDPAMPLVKSPVKIGSDVWICAQVFVGPGVEIGDNSIIGACSVVMKSVGPNSIGHGNPFRMSKQRSMST